MSYWLVLDLSRKNLNPKLITEIPSLKDLEEARSQARHYLRTRSLPEAPLDTFRVGHSSNENSTESAIEIPYSRFKIIDEKGGQHEI